MEERIAETLGKMKDGCAFNIADALFPNLIEEPEEFRSAMSGVAEILEQMEEKGTAESAGDFAGVRFFKLAGAEMTDKREVSAKRKRSAEDVERKALEVLENGNLSASEITAKIFPFTEDFRARTSQIFVCLKRLEKKGKVAKAEKKGKRQYYMLAQTAGRENADAEKEAEPAERGKEETETNEAAEERPEIHFEDPLEALPEPINITMKEEDSAKSKPFIWAVVSLAAVAMLIGASNAAGLSILPGAPKEIMPLTAFLAAALAITVAVFIFRRRGGEPDKLKKTDGEGIPCE